MGGGGVAGMAGEFDPVRIRGLVAEIRLRLALMPPEVGNGSAGRPVLTVRADTEAVVVALEAHLTAAEMRRIRWRVKG